MRFFKVFNPGSPFLYVAVNNIGQTFLYTEDKGWRRITDIAGNQIRWQVINKLEILLATGTSGPVEQSSTQAMLDKE